MSRSSSISSTSGFVTPQGSIISLPLQDEDDAQVSSGRTYAKPLDKGLPSLNDAVNIEAGSIKNDSDSTDTEVDTNAKHSEEISTPEPFLEHLSNSSRSSLNDSDRMEEELAELGIYDSELLAEDIASDSEDGKDEDREDLEAGQYEAVGPSGSNGKRRMKKKAKWKEAEEELRRGGNRSLAEVRTGSYTARHVAARTSSIIQLIIMTLVVFSWSRLSSWHIHWLFFLLFLSCHIHSYLRESSSSYRFLLQ